MDINEVTTHRPILDCSSPAPGKGAVHVGAPWSAPDKTTRVIRGRQFKPGPMTEEEVVALVREVMGSCSDRKLQQKLWRGHLAAAPVVRGPKQLLAGAPAGAAGPARPWSQGYGTHPLTYTSFTLCTVPATATICYRCLPVPCTLLWGFILLLSNCTKDFVV